MKKSDLKKKHLYKLPTWIMTWSGQFDEEMVIVEIIEKREKSCLYREISGTTVSMQLKHRLVLKDILHIGHKNDHPELFI